jgi:neutral ceramidase
MTLKAGTGRADVSPREPVFLWGYPHVERMSTGVHDPLLATALCLDDGRRRAVTVSVDVLYIDRAWGDPCRGRIAERTGIPPDAVMIAATHTHSGPVTADILATSDDAMVPKADPRLIAGIADGIVDAACAAVEALEPAELAVASAAVDGVGCNRISPDAARDPDAALLMVRRAGGGRPIGVQIVYAMHPTVMHEDSTLASADFPGVARRVIEETFPGSRVVYLNGPCGNLSPRYHVRAQTFEEAERLGTRLGTFAIDALSSLEDAAFVREAAVGARRGEVALKGRAFPPVDEAEARLRAARETYNRLRRDGAPHGPVRTAECDVFGAEEIVTLARAQADGTLAAVRDAHARAEVQVLFQGPLALAGFPGELFVEYGLEVKRRAPGRAAAVSMANGHLHGYITTPGAKGYEAGMSMFDPEGGARLVETALRLIQEGAR